MTGGTFPNNTTADHCSSSWDCGTSPGPYWDNAIYTGSSYTNNLYVGYSYIHHTGNTQFQMNGQVNTNLIWEYDWVSYNHTGQNGNHDEAYSLYGSNVIIRYNVFQDICSTGIITTAGGGNPLIGNWEVYGNLFFWDATYAAMTTAYQNATLDNGIVDFLGETMSGHVYFYNNTIAGIKGTGVNATNPVAGVGGGDNLGSPAIVIENNLWWNCDAATGYQSYHPSGSSLTIDYNAYFAGSSSNFSYFTETHGQVVGNSTNPFVNSSANTIAGFVPATNTAAAVTLASPYNVDMLGITRGVNGTWDRGALQISPGVTLPAPTGLKLLP